MSWVLKLKRLDLPGLIPSPVLLVLVLAGSALLIFKEWQLTQREDTVVTVAIVQEYEGAFDEPVELPIASEEVISIADTLEAQFLGRVLTAQGLQSSPEYQALKPVVAEQVLEVLLSRLLADYRNEEIVSLYRAMQLDVLNNDGLLFLYAMALSRSGADAAALDAYAQHFQRRPLHQAGVINYGLALIQAEQYAQALPVLEAAVAISSGERKAKAYALMGRCFMELGQFGDAVRVLRSSIEYRPGNAPTWRRYANAMAAMGVAAEAEVLATYEKALSLAPGDYRSSLDIADYLFSRARFPEAIPHYRAAHRLAQDRFTVQLQRAVNLAISGRPRSAQRILKTLVEGELSTAQKTRVRALDAVIRRSKSRANKLVDKLSAGAAVIDPLLHGLLLAVVEPAQARQFAAALDVSSLYRGPLLFSVASQLSRSGEYGEAGEIYRELAAMYTQSSYVYYEYARVLVKLGNIQQALKVVTLARQLEPTSKKITLEYARQFITQKMYPEALTALDELLKQYPRYVKALLLKADIYVATGDHMAAVAVLSTVLGYDEQNVDVAIRLIKSHMAAAQFEAALKVCDELVLANTGLVEARELRMRILLNLGDEQSAFEESQSILKLDPDNAAAQKCKLQGC